MSLVPGTRIGAYQIVASIGSGGMGEVYRAHDPRLGRDVALKVLPADMAADPSRLERFTREARAIAALNHPHIVTIYSTEEADGIRFLTMELVEGRPLDAIIPANGMPLARFLELALPLADALNAAHQKHITHRDLKPANVMVASDGRLKVLDFGLARVGGQHPTNQTIEATRQLLTGEGTIVGTMPYMSPEQVEGKQLDHRTDLFSLGVMFHEMLVGTRPFTGASSPQLMSSILRDTPSTTGDLRADVPEALSRLIVRCLEKNPDDRVQTARDVYNELRHVQKQIESGSVRGAGSAAADVLSIADSLWIAVLPFTTRGTDPEGETLAAGLTEDITTGLARFPSLSVVAPQSAGSFKGSPLDVRQIAERLRARYIMGGSVRKSASGIRVAAHLTDATSGAQLWTETYDRAGDRLDIYAVQDDVTDRVVSTVADKTGVLARSMVQAVRGIALDKLSARELVYRCWGAQLNPTQPQHEELRAALESFLARQPDEAELWAQLSQSYTFEYSLWFNPLPEPLVRARRAARRAIELDPSNQEGWVSLGLACFHGHDEAGLLEAVDRVLRLNARASNAVAWMGNVLTHTGAYDRGCEITERAMALNASHAGWYHFAPFNRAFARGDFNDALQCARRVNVAGFHWMHLAIAAAAGHLGLSAEGAAAVEALHAVAPPLGDDANLREFVTRWYWEEDMIEALLDGVRRSKEAAAAPETERAPARPRSSAASASPARRPTSSAAVASGTWVAVIPFTPFSSGEDSRTLADGLTEDITAGLARFPYLSVVAEHSARQHRGTTADVRQIGKALGARYILDGSIRRGGTAVRITARLIDAESGAQLWNETYQRALSASSPLEIQDDVTDRIVATLADVYGVLLRSMGQPLRELALDTLGVEEVLLRYWSYQRQPEPAEHGRLRARLEQLVEHQPQLTDAWAALSDLYSQEVAHGLNPLPDSLGRAERAAARALDLDAMHQHAWQVLAVARYFQRDRDGFVHAAERALTLNPRNTNATAFLAFLFSQLGETDRACEMTERAMAINPAYPGWYHFVFFDRQYIRGEYDKALATARKVNMPYNLWSPWSIAIAAAQLGRAADATAALDAFVALAPALEDEAALRRTHESWRWNQPAHIELVMDGYRKALALRSAGVPQRPPSGAVAAVGTWIAVIPFASSSSDEDVRTLADGLTEDITAGLARFSYLSVVAEHSARQHKGSTADVRQIGKALGARYILDGSIRRGGSSFRITARLVDADSGAQLWSETYTRELQQSSLLAVQDDVTDRVVATVADVHGVLLRSASVNVRAVPLEQLTPEELRLRYWSYHRQHAPVEHGLLRDHFERLAEAQPAFAPFWAVLAHLYLHEYGFGFNARPEPLRRARRAVDRALELDSLNQHAWEALAFTLFFEQDREGFTHAAERVQALNPRNANAMALMGILFVHAGELERGCALTDRASAINPDHPGWYHIARGSADYASGQFESALRSAKRINMPQHLWAHLLVAAAAAQLGRTAEALSALETLLGLEPAFADEAVMVAASRRWKWLPEHSDRMVDGYRKAMALRREAARARPPSDSATSSTAVAVAAAGIGAAAVARHTQTKGLRIAVLPFTSRGGDAATSLADGLTDDITTGLSRFAHLRVLSKAAAAAATGALLEPRVAGARLGARYLLEGNVRTAGHTVRITVRLIDTENDANLWADNIDRDAASGGLTLQDDVASRIVATVGDPTGVLAHAMAMALADMPLDRLSVAELVIRFHAYQAQFRPVEHEGLRDAFERLLEREPRAADGWACLANLYSHEHSLGINPLPDPLERQRRAAERALEIDPGSQYAWLALTRVHLFSRDFVAFRGALDRTLALNPLNADLLAACAILLTAAGEREEAVALVTRAAALKPQHPGWYHLPLFNNHYYRAEYAEALREVKRANLPLLPRPHMNVAAVAGQLGSEPEARAALDTVRRLNASLLEPARAREEFARFLFDEELVDRLMEGFEKALSLTRVAVPSAASASGLRPASDVRAGGIDMSVTVRPFAVRDGDRDASDLAEGLAENIATGLSRFQYPSVRSGSAAASARFAVAGGVKRSGRAIRANVRLLEVATGSTLWAEQYDRDGSADLFTIQDEIGDRVVATLADEGGALYRVFAVAVKASTDQEHAVLRLFVRFGEFVEHFTPEEHGFLRDQYDALVENQRSNATAWAHLAILYGLEVFFAFNPLPDAVARVRRAAERAVGLDSANQGAWYALADAAFFERNAAAFRSAANRAIELNPLRSRTVGAIGLLRAFAGETAAGAALVTRAISLNPRHPGWFHLALFLDAFQRGDADRALGEAARINLPHVPVDGRLFAIAAAGRFERESEAAAAISELRRDYPHLLDARRAREEWAIRIWDRELLDGLVSGFEQALQGLSTSARAGTPAKQAGTDSGSAIAVQTVDTALRVVVLPLTARAGDETASSLAGGLTDDITAALSRFSYLRVVSRDQVNAGVGEGAAAGKQLGARYLLDGSVRTSGRSVRVSARLVDVETSAHLWAENFDHDLGAGPFAVQDEVSGKIAARVADPSGVLVRSMVASLKDKPDAAMTVFDLTLQFFAHLETFTEEQHARLRDRLEEALEHAPNDATGWAILADLYAQESALGHNQRPDPVGRQRRAAERAISIDATCQYGWVNLASSHYLSGDTAAFRHEAERAIALNPLNTHVLSHIGSGLALSGSWDRGAALIRQALELNPNLPRHIYVIPFLDHYRRGEDEAALADAKKINLPGLHNGHFARAVAAGQLQRREEAQTALDDLRRVKPEMTDAASARATLSAWLHDSALVDRLIEGLEKALALAGTRDRPPSSAPTPFTPPMSPALTNDLAITVRPFLSRGGESADDLAEGLTDDVTAGLSRFSYLRVVPRASAENAAPPARYVLEGQVRWAHPHVRISARLNDTQSGATLWAENFDGPADTDALRLQDDVAPRIIATVADANGVLLRSMVATLRQRPLGDHTVSELVLRFFGFLEHFDPAEHAELRDRLTAALAVEPGHADGWACLSALIEHEDSHGLNPRPHSLDRARAAAERSIAANPVCQEGWRAMASVALFARDASGVRVAAERAIAINPLNTGTVAVCGGFLARSGHWDRGLEVIQQAMRPNFHYPGWLHIVPFVYHYRRTEYAEALQHAKQINMPRFAKSHVCVAAAAGQLELRDDARAALDALARVDPASLEPAHVRPTFASWIWSGDDLDHLLEGFRKAKSLAASGATALERSSATSTSATSRATGPSVAVLPFADLSAEKNQDWFCDGIAEEILNALAQLPGLRVAARTSAFSFRDRADAAKAIGETLGVSTVLEGSVRRAGERVRITVQLVDPLTGFQLWSERYDRELKDIFEIQDEIARSVAARLKVALGSGTEGRLVPAQTPNIEAYELYLRGRALLYRRGGSILPALDHFRRAVELDPDFAPAWAGIGDAYVVCGYFGLLPGGEVRRQGLAAARRALVLDPNSADAFTSLAALRQICENDIDGAGAAFRKALELNPAYVQARCWYALFYLQAALGEFEEGVAEARRAQELDPLSAYTAAILCVALVTAGRAADGVEEGRKAVAIDPQSFVARWTLGLALLCANQLDEAEAVLEQAAAMSERHHFAIANLAMTHAKKGEPDRARALHEELVRRAATGFVPATSLVLSVDAAGDRQQALVYARQALEDREPPFILLSRNWPDFAELRQDARFAALIRALDTKGPEAPWLA